MAQCLRLEMKKLTDGAVSTSLICPYAINTGMFDGIKINYEWLFPLLQPTFVAQKVVDAVKFKDEMVSSNNLSSCIAAYSSCFSFSFLCYCYCYAFAFALFPLTLPCAYIIDIMFLLPLCLPVAYILLLSYIIIMHELEVKLNAL